MNNEGKKESLWIRVKRYFNNVFGKNKIKALPEIKEEPKQELSRSKEEYIKLYQDVKDKKVDITTLTEEELKICIALVKEEINFLDKKIDQEKTEINMCKKKIEYYKNKCA